MYFYFNKNWNWCQYHDFQRTMLIYIMKVYTKQSICLHKSKTVFPKINIVGKHDIIGSNSINLNF